MSRVNTNYEPDSESGYSEDDASLTSSILRPKKSRHIVSKISDSLVPNSSEEIESPDGARSQADSKAYFFQLPEG